MGNLLPQTLSRQRYVRLQGTVATAVLLLLLHGTVGTFGCCPQPGHAKPLFATPYPVFCRVVLACYDAPGVGPLRPLEHPSGGVGAGSGGWRRTRAQPYCRGPAQAGTPRPPVNDWFMVRW